MAKRKVTISLDCDLLSAVDRWIEQAAAKSRSAIIENALQVWFERERYKALELQTEAYYRALSSEERDEDRQWTEGTSLQAQSFWDEE